MHPFGQTWRFTRFRLNEALVGLRDEQMEWRIYAGAHSIFEIAYHIAGAEHYWSARLSAKDPSATPLEAKLDRAVHDGFLRDGLPPFGTPAELSRDALMKALEFTASRLAPVIEDPTPEQLGMPLISPVGDRVTGEAGLARLCQHAGYHTGQVWLIRMAPKFPA